jgi:hypothetical protein
MARHAVDDQAWEDEDWDADDLNCQERDDEDDEPTVPCPYCRREIFEDSFRCPHCGQYLSEEDAPAGRKPWWIVVGMLLCLAALWVWIAHR